MAIAEHLLVPGLEEALNLRPLELPGCTLVVFCAGHAAPTARTLTLCHEVPEDAECTHADF